MTEIILNGPGPESVLLDIDPNDHIGRVILKSRNWYEFPLLSDIHKRTLRLKGTAVDIGAHIGNHSIWMAKYCGLQVLAFEPFSQSYNQLCKNVINNQVNVCPVPFAVGSGKGWGVIIPPKDGNTGTTAVEYTNTGNIPTTALDSYDLDDVVLIKIDVEEHRAAGTLSAVFQGAKNTIDNCHPMIYAEGDKELIQSLIPENYSCFGMFGKTATYGFEWKG